MEGEFATAKCVSPRIAVRSYQQTKRRENGKSVYIVKIKNSEKEEMKKGQWLKKGLEEKKWRKSLFKGLGSRMEKVRKDDHARLLC